MPTLNVTFAEEQLSDGATVYVATCDVLDIASQGSTMEEAHANVQEAVALWLESASPKEKDTRLYQPLRHRTTIEVPDYGQTADTFGR